MVTETETAPIKGHTTELEISGIIVPDEGNPRTTFDDPALFDLGESMAQHSQLAPVIINRIDGKNMLVAGERRLRAAKKAKMEFIEAKVFENLDPLRAQRMAMAENRDRVPLSVIEKARGYNRLLDLGMKEKEIAADEHCTVDTIRRHSALLKLPEEVQHMMVRPHYPLPIHQARALLKLPKVEDMIQMARKVAPKVGPVVSEEQTRRWICEEIGEPLPFKENDKPTPKEQFPDSPHGNGPTRTTAKGDAAAKKADPKAVKLKPVQATIGSTGKLILADFHEGITLKNATVSFKLGGEVDILNFKELHFSFDKADGDNWKKLQALLKKAQPKVASATSSSKKKTVTKKKVAKTKKAKA